MLRDTLKDFVVLPHRDKFGRRIVVFKMWDANKWSYKAQWDVWPYFGAFVFLPITTKIICRVVNKTEKVQSKTARQVCGR